MFQKLQVFPLFFDYQKAVVPCLAVVLFGFLVESTEFLTAKFYENRFCVVKILFQSTIYFSAFSEFCQFIPKLFAIIHFSIVTAQKMRLVKILFLFA